MPNDPGPHAFTDADVVVKRDLRTQMDNSIARHKSRLANETTRKDAFRFTLRDLFWLTLLLAAYCGWAMTYRALLAERERTEMTRAWARSLIGDDVFPPNPP